MDSKERKRRQARALQDAFDAGRSTDGFTHEAMIAALKKHGFELQPIPNFRFSEPGTKRERGTAHE